MTTLEQVLLILVAFATLILLTFSIILITMSLIVMKRIKIIVDRARAGAESVAEIVEEVKDQMANPTNVASFITKMINRRRRRDGRQDRDK